MLIIQFKLPKINLSPQHSTWAANIKLYELNFQLHVSTFKVY